jgi:ubiquitin-protein ligase
MARRLRMLLENYVTAKEEGKKEGYDIKNVEEDNYEHYYVLFKPKSGIYRDQQHILEIKTEYGREPDKYYYPINAPFVLFNTAVHHTNISSSGSICLDILKDKSKWVPTYDFNSIIMNILLLFGEPNNASPFNGEASRDYVACEKKFKELKKINLTIEEHEALWNECFETFKKKADTIAEKNDLSKYAQWFPQLDPNWDGVEDTTFAKIHALYKSMGKKAESKETPSESVKKPKKPRYAKHQKASGV